MNDEIDQSYWVNCLLPANSCSRIAFILTLGMMIFSFFPSIHSICFCKIIQAKNKSQKSLKSSSRRKNEYQQFAKGFQKE